ncbi:hypothetical protein EYF80_026595 [Liparis tanakae]|uniref:Uncharacterized protein n=1 Tax=Liparis tanakae TaxID=230148 RepID=A0A4Z2HBX4_9TELE|nr:hypothetical protein EYF80_026595 [Liparis tanakae]
MTDSIPPGTSSDAFCMASARTFTTYRAGGHRGRSTAASDVTNTAGWQWTVFASSSSGPCRHREPPAHARELAALAGEEEHGAASGVLRGSPNRGGRLVVRERHAGFGWRSVSSTRGARPVGAQPPAQRGQRPGGANGNY